MKITESFVYSIIAFTGIYVIIALAMRVFDLTTTFYAHVTGGIVATFVGVSLFIFLLLRKK